MPPVSSYPQAGVGSCSQSWAGTRGLVELPYAAAIIMPLLETKPFSAIFVDGQLQTCGVTASTWVVVLVVASSFVVAPWVPQGGCVWLVTGGGVELPLLVEVGGRRHQRSFVSRCGFYSHGYDWRGILAVV